METEEVLIITYDTFIITIAHYLFFFTSGIYLASIVYCEDKVLVTSEDFLPVIEIDETYPSSLYSDYHWLMKVNTTALN